MGRELVSGQSAEMPTSALHAAGQGLSGWDAADASFDGTGGTFNVFEDVFQLVDMPHTLNEPFSQPQFGLFDMAGQYAPNS
jgi:hypothetical protein